MDLLRERVAPTVSDGDLTDLRVRLEHVRWPDQLRDTTWDHGVPLDVVRRLHDAWRTYDVRAAFAALDHDLPGWCATIDGHRIHFGHVVPAGDAPRRHPILLLHGWPSSYAELRTVALDLARQGHEVVVPSLPGHGFSSIPEHVGFGADACAPLLVRLMVDVLGHERFVVHGGDRGAFVGTSMAIAAPEHLVGLHVSLPGGIPGEGADRTDEETRWLTETAAWLVEEGGYSSIQGTRPQTLAYAMHDSPVGQLAWIVEKHQVWTDCDGDLWRVFTEDQLLLNASIYWFTGTFRSASHWYWEHRVRTPSSMRPVTVDVPTGVIRYPCETMRVPRSAVARKHRRLVHWTDKARGGHFPAYEDPLGLVDDIVAFVAALD
jgi:pimeloyl-ACP methyl ester carboxylesterase